MRQAEEMILVWNNTNAFKQHLEDMRLFRESHNHAPYEIAKLLQNMPVYETNSIREKVLHGDLAKKQRMLKITPIWNIKLAEGTQN
jgi:hypothetical protein